MTNIIALFDNDLVYKLAYFGLWDEVLSVLNIKTVYCLNAVGQNQFKTSIKRINAKLTKENKPLLSAEEELRFTNNLSRIVQSIKRIPAEWFNPVLSQKHMSPNIDSGEAELLAILLSRSEIHLLITGDHRFVRAFRTLFPDQYAQLQQARRIRIFEEVLLILMESYGYDWLYTRLVAARFADGTVHLALGVAKRNTEEEFRYALDSSRGFTDGPY
ncbi:MAG: hypothetical protein QM523_08035 [Candidatus Pacebacteria bacterium]|nr:hypothetical protein [Candidatus Paceibacterota bacterium]